MWGLLFDPIPDSPNEHYENCMRESIRENYWWDLWSERVKFKHHILTQQKLSFL